MAPQRSLDSVTVTQTTPKSYPASDKEIPKQESETSRPVLALESKRYPFEPWQTIPMGEPSVFESMRNKANAASVRSTASEIAEFEGPIELNRLCRLVTYCFGLGRA